MTNKVISAFFYLMLGLSINWLGTGCGSLSTIATVKPGFDAYEKVAIIWELGRDEMRETYFMAYWMDVFPDQTVVERSDLLKIIREQDLLPNRLNQKTRARMRNVLGVKALVLISLRSQDRGRYITPRETTHLSIKVIDTETGEVSVSAVSKGNDNKIESMIIEAIQLIKEKAINLTYMGPKPF